MLGVYQTERRACAGFAGVQAGRWSTVSRALCAKKACERQSRRRTLQSRASLVSSPLEILQLQQPDEPHPDEQLVGEKTGTWSGEWFDGEVGICNPVVRRFADPNGEEGGQTRWLMWFSSGDGHGIGLATSLDGTGGWKRFLGSEDIGGAVMSSGGSESSWWWFDSSGGMRLGDVQMVESDVVLGAGEGEMADEDEEGGVLFMFYRGESSATSPESASRIGIALSKDGFYWSRVEGEDPSGSVLDGRRGVDNPQVLRFGSGKERQFIMYLLDRSGGRGVEQIRTAISGNGVSWSERNGPAPSFDADSRAYLSGGVASFQIVSKRRRQGGGFLMLCQASAGASVGVLRSADGVAWAMHATVEVPCDGAVRDPYGVVLGDSGPGGEVRLRIYCTADAAGRPAVGFTEVSL